MRLPHLAASVALPLLASVVATVVVATPSTARAGGYVSAGFGGGASLGGELEKNFASEDHDSGRIALGHRAGPLALEVSYAGAGLTGTSDFVRRLDYTSRTVGVDLKLHAGLIGGLEAYGKVGLARTWLDAPAARDELAYDGRGYALGVGLQYRLDLEASELAVWLDYTRQQTDLRDGDRRALDGSLGVVALGLSLGFL